jgi:hypothetical protein
MIESDVGRAAWGALNAVENAIHWRAFADVAVWRCPE